MIESSPDHLPPGVESSSTQVAQGIDAENEKILSNEKRTRCVAKTSYCEIAPDADDTDMSDKHMSSDDGGGSDYVLHSSEEETIPESSEEVSGYSPEIPVKRMTRDSSCDAICKRSLMMDKHKKADNTLSDIDSSSEFQQDSYPSTIDETTAGSSSEDEEVLDEDNVMRDCYKKGIFIRRIRKSETGSKGRKKMSDRVHNSYQFCNFCSHSVSNFAQHIYRQHKLEQEVIDIQSEPIRLNKQRLLNILRSKMNHFNNMCTLRNKKGEMILLRRPEHILDISSYGPCPNCFAWVSKKLLWKHQKSCPLQPTLQSTAAILTQSDTLCGRIKTIATKKLIKEVFSIMHLDDIGNAARQDHLIIMLGNQWMDKNVGNRLKRGRYTSQVMRLAAKLLINLRKIQPLNSPANNMNDYLKPEYFETIVKATLLASLSNLDDEDELQSPSNALKLGYDITRLINIKIGLAIQFRNSLVQEEAEKLLQLMRIFWPTRVTKLARVILLERQYNKEHCLPPPDDLKKLNTYLEDAIGKLNLKSPKYEDYRRAAEVLGSKLLMYNRRRTGEIEGLR